MATPADIIRKLDCIGATQAILQHLKDNDGKLYKYFPPATPAEAREDLAWHFLKEAHSLGLIKYLPTTDFCSAPLTPFGEQVLEVLEKTDFSPPVQEEVVVPPMLSAEETILQMTYSQDRQGSFFRIWSRMGEDHLF